VKLEHMFVPFYLTVCLAGVVAAIVVPRLPPLSWKKDVYSDGTPLCRKQEAIPHQHSVLSYGYHRALTKAEGMTDMGAVAREGVKNALDMIWRAAGGDGRRDLCPDAGGAHPGVQLAGGALRAFARAAATAGGGSRFQDHHGGLRRHVHPGGAGLHYRERHHPLRDRRHVGHPAHLHVGSGRPVLGSKIPVKLWELFVIFLLRTLVTLPVIAGVAHLLF
jgi:hypothetical protein